MIPGTPKDLLVYIAGLLPIKPLRFILISTFARLPSVVSSTFAGNTLMRGDWKSSLVIYAITFFLVGVFYNVFLIILLILFYRFCCRTTPKHQQLDNSDESDYDSEIWIYESSKFKKKKALLFHQELTVVLPLSSRLNMRLSRHTQSHPASHLRLQAEPLKHRKTYPLLPSCPPP